MPADRPFAAVSVPMHTDSLQLCEFVVHMVAYDMSVGTIAA
jgi:hypothetical protein